MHNTPHTHNRTMTTTTYCEKEWLALLKENKELRVKLEEANAKMGKISDLLVADVMKCPPTPIIFTDKTFLPISRLFACSNSKRT